MVRVVSRGLVVLVAKAPSTTDHGTRPTMPSHPQVEFSNPGLAPSLRISEPFCATHFHPLTSPEGYCKQSAAYGEIYSCRLPHF